MFDDDFLTITRRKFFFFGAAAGIAVATPKILLPGDPGFQMPGVHDQAYHVSREVRVQSYGDSPQYVVVESSDPSIPVGEWIQLPSSLDMHGNPVHRMAVQKGHGSTSKTTVYEMKFRTRIR